MTNNQEPINQALTDSNEYRQAKKIVYYLLKYRERSTDELRQRLKAKKIHTHTISLTIEYFQKLDLLNDRRFAKQWIQSRLNRPLGINRIRQELQLKGIDKTIIDSELSLAVEAYPEKEIVLELTRRKMRQYQHLEPQKRQRRLYGFLSRKGFSYSIIRDVIRSL